uniref:Uncharacterized protein n=1 Tax=Arundo donax TaxID=35708 RepID=A0A0A9HAE6_ARUDO
MSYHLPLKIVSVVMTASWCCVPCPY